MTDQPHPPADVRTDYVDALKRGIQAQLPRDEAPVSVRNESWHMKSDGRIEVRLSGPVDLAP